MASRYADMPVFGRMLWHTGIHVFVQSITFYGADQLPQMEANSSTFSSEMMVCVLCGSIVAVALKKNN
jgi:hypothetical protein